MKTLWAYRRGWYVVFATLVLACGDVTTDLVVEPPATTDAAANAGGSAGDGGADATAAGSAGRSGDGGAGASTIEDGGTGAVECRDNDDCRCTDGNCDRDLCDVPRGRCVECVEDAHCDEPSERCSGALGECAMPCAEASDCDADEQCDAVLRFCVECVADADCGFGEVCRRSECTR